MSSSCNTHACNHTQKVHQCLLEAHTSICYHDANRPVVAEQAMCC